MKIRILIVDDLTKDMESLSNMLRSAEYEVLNAYNGSDALEIMKQVPYPDLVLLDIVMPKMDSFAVCKQIKSTAEHTGYIPVIMITTSDDATHKVRGIEAGADDFLDKAVTRDDLLVRIKATLRLKQDIVELQMRDKARTKLDLASINAMNYVSQINAEKILVIDDNLAHLFQMRTKLNEVFALVKECDNPQIALDMATQIQYSAFVVSTNLLNFDSLRLCAKLSLGMETRNLPLIILVKPNCREKIAEGLKIGVNDYVIMPIDVNELLARVSMYLRKKRCKDALLSKEMLQDCTIDISNGTLPVYNRSYFDAYLNIAFENAKENHKELSVVIIELCYLENNSDCVMSSDIVNKVAQIILQHIRMTDLVARYNDKEFAIVMRDVNFNYAEIVTRNIKQAIEDSKFSMPVIGEEFANGMHCTIHAGVVCMNKTHQSVTNMLNDAGRKLEIAKEARR